MTKKDFFRLIIKLCGLYLLISSIRNFVQKIFAYIELPADVISILLFISPLIILIFIAICLIIAPDKIIVWLKLDLGFEADRIVFQNFNSEKVLSLALCITGFLLLIVNIPVFIVDAAFAFKSSLHRDYVSDTLFPWGSFNDYYNWARSFIYCLFGYLILKNQKGIARILLLVNKRNERKNDEK